MHGRLYVPSDVFLGFLFFWIYQEVELWWLREFLTFTLLLQMWDQIFSFDKKNPSLRAIFTWLLLAPKDMQLDSSGINFVIFLAWRNQIRKCIWFIQNLKWYLSLHMVLLLFIVDYHLCSLNCITGIIIHCIYPMWNIIRLPSWMVCFVLWLEVQRRYDTTDKNY